MLRVTVRVPGAPAIVLGAGDRLLFGRAPTSSIAAGSTDDADVTLLTLPACTRHVSRVVGEIGVGRELVRLRFQGASEAQLSSLFDAAGGARRATLTAGMSALLDEGENQLLMLRGRALENDGYADLLMVISVEESVPEPPASPQRGGSAPEDEITGVAPGLTRDSREWYVALALAEPWLTGADDYPRPPSNREIFERVRDWRGYAWNLERAQRVDEAIRSIAGIAFGPADDPFRPVEGRRVSNVRFAVGKRIAEVRLVTPEDLRDVERAATR